MIIPDPSFDIHDMMSFECVIDNSSSQSLISQGIVELGTLESDFSEFIHSTNLKPSNIPLYSVIFIFYLYCRA